MKKITLLALLILILVAASALWSRTSSPKPTPAAPAAPERIAAPGRVEPASEEILVSSEVPGKLKAVFVEEGQRVRRGQVIAELENAELHARIAVEEAQVKLREAELRRLLNGARRQERSEALASAREAQAVMDNARLERDRRVALFRSGDISRAEADRAETQYAAARARYEALTERHSFLDADARDDDRARAEAEIEIARARLREARAALGKTVVKSPIAGVVLRKHLKTGETVTDAPGVKILTLGDDSALRVRVDVDETDVAKLYAGQQAYVTADAYGERRFAGRVARVGQMLGRKNVRTDEPAERVDTKILETLIELEPGTKLPTGLRVNAYLLLDKR